MGDKVFTIEYFEASPKVTITVCLYMKFEFITLMGALFWGKTCHITKALIGSKFGFLQFSIICTIVEVKFLCACLCCNNVH
jgi:hypothetical protein